MFCARMLPSNRFACLILAAIADCPAAPVRAADQALKSPSTDKSGFHLFHATPPALMRELSSDRPDKTESPYTVDAGHFQVELDWVSYTYDHNTTGSADTRTHAYAIAPVNFKVGLLNNLDFQVVLETYNHVRTEDRGTGSTTTASGMGDITTRLKVNLWGNDTGSTALSLMPFVKFPSSQDGLGNDAVEGGLIIPFGFALPGEWDSVLMTEFDWLRDDDNSGYHVSFINSITFAHDICGKLAGYAEFYSEVSAEGGANWIGTADFGLTYKVTPDLQLDAGANVGITDSADDLNLFTGLAWRF